LRVWLNEQLTRDKTFNIKHGAVCQGSGEDTDTDSFEVTKVYFKNRGQANDRSRAQLFVMSTLGPNLMDSHMTRQGCTRWGARPSQSDQVFPHKRALL
jgi:hypothetical protein